MSTNIYLIISFFFSMFVITIVVVAIVVLISLIYLHFNKTSKNVEKQLQLYKNAVFSQISTPSLLFNIKSNSLLYFASISLNFAFYPRLILK